MRQLFRTATVLALAGYSAMGLVAQSQELVLYEREGLGGASLPLTREVSNFSDLRFNDTARSLVANGPWEVCSDARFSGKCTVVEGRVDNLTAIGFGANISSARPVSNGGNRVGITLYPEPDYRGEPRQFVRDTDNLNDVRFNDRAMSVRISGGDWTLCEDANYDGRCVSIRSDVRNLNDIGLGGKLSSMRSGRFDRSAGGGRGGQGRASIELFDQPGFGGQGIELLNAETDLNRFNFNDKARSARVTGRWLLCEHNDYEGSCELIDTDIFDLARFNLAGRVSSLRPAQRGETSGSHYGSGSGSGWGGRRDARADAVGSTSAFFVRPTSGGLAIDQCVDSSGRNCGPEAADRFCRAVGYRQAAYSTPSRSSVPTVHIGDGRRCSGRCAPIEDVLCIR